MLHSPYSIVLRDFQFCSHRSLYYQIQCSVIILHLEALQFFAQEKSPKLDKELKLKNKKEFMYFDGKILSFFFFLSSLKYIFSLSIERDSKFLPLFFFHYISRLTSLVSHNFCIPIFINIFHILRLC